MPELPEVEVVRRGIESWALGRPIADVDVIDARSLRRHTAGSADFVSRLRGRTLDAARRLGKYVWLTLSDSDDVLVVHLGMSGQVLMMDADSPAHPHLRVRVSFADAARELHFVDQRIFGGMWIDPLIPETGLPISVAHIATDPFDPDFDVTRTSRRIRASSAGIKRVILDQSVISGVGNIYADEALWRARLHYARPANALTARQVRDLLAAIQDVMAAALAAGGTSFDALYVNVNGQSGYFSRDLAVYGQEGEPCPRCGTPIRREPFMNRSSFRCPRCQRAPHKTRAPQR